MASLIPDKIKLPPELDNDERAAVLFSPFRGKDANPTSWNSKMNFWQNFLEKSALENKLLTFDVNTLPQLFLRNGLAPKCLPTVVEELHRLGKVKPIEEFKKSNSWLSWSFTTLVKEPLSWGVTQIFGSPKKTNSVFVWPDVLKNVSDQVLSHLKCKVHQGIIHHVCTYSQFEGFSDDILSNKEHIEMVLNYLQGSKKIYMRQTEQHGLLIKVFERNKTTVAPFEDVDVQIFEIQHACLKMESELNSLSSRIQGLTCEAKLNLKNKNKAMALHCLRKRKHVEKAAIAKSSVLHNLEDILQRIEDTQVNLVVLQACESGAAVLKQINKDVSLDKVETVMDDIQEAIQNADDVNEAIQSVGPTTNDDDFNAQLENELKSLLDESNQANTLLDDDLLLPDLSQLSLSDPDFPQVPTHSPSASTIIKPRMEERRKESLLSS